MKKLSKIIFNLLKNKNINFNKNKFPKYYNKKIKTKNIYYFY